MPEKKIDQSQEDERNATAFEHALGTLRGSERIDTENKLRTDTALQDAVHFWDEQLMGLHPEIENDIDPQAFCREFSIILQTIKYGNT